MWSFHGTHCRRVSWPEPEKHEGRIRRAALKVAVLKKEGKTVCEVRGRTTPGAERKTCASPPPRKDELKSG